MIIFHQEFQQLSEQVRQFYFGNLPIDENSLEQYIDLLSDVNFIYGINKAAIQHANKTSSKTFYYR